MTAQQRENLQEEKRFITNKKEQKVLTPTRKESNKETIRGYQNLLQTIISLKRPLVLTAAVGITLQILTLMALFVLLPPNDGRGELDPMEICYRGMKSIFEKSDHGDLLHESVLRDIKKYEFNFDRIATVTVTDSMNCTVTARFADGDHRYKVKLEKSPLFRHGYRILDARGLK